MTNSTITTYDSGAEREVDSTGKGLKELQDRFAITPLYTRYYEHSLDEEFMCDINTGSTAIKHADGTIITENEVSRKNYHVSIFETDMVCHGMSRKAIYDISYNNDVEVHKYTEGENVLDSAITIISPNSSVGIGQMCMSIDASFMSIITDDSNLLRHNNYDPVMTLQYTANGIPHTITTNLSNLRGYVIPVNSPRVTLNSIILSHREDDSTDTMRSMYILVHSILVGF